MNDQLLVEWKWLDNNGNKIAVHLGDEITIRVARLSEPSFKYVKALVINLSERFKNEPNTIGLFMYEYESYKEQAMWMKIDHERKIINCEPSKFSTEEILTHHNIHVRNLAL